MEQVQDGRCLSSHFITQWPYSWDSWRPSPEGQAHLTSQVGPQSSHHLGSGVCEGETWEFRECPRRTLLTPHLSTEPSLSERPSHLALGVTVSQALPLSSLTWVESEALPQQRLAPFPRQLGPILQPSPTYLVVDISQSEKTPGTGLPCE